MATPVPPKPPKPAAVPKWSLTGKDFTGPREDVVATIDGMQSIPKPFADGVVAAINALDKEVRGVKLNIHFTSTGKEFHVNGHCESIY